MIITKFRRPKKVKNMPKTQQHSQQVWEDFWQKEPIDQVYSNSGRIIQQIMATGDLKDKYIVEIGAGSGRDGFKLVDCGAAVILLDYAENSLRIIEQMSRELNKPVHLVRGDAFHLPFKSNVIDVVYHQGLLEHFTNPEDIVAENYRVTKVNGVTLADVPQRYHFYTLVKHVLIWLNKWFAGWETEFSIGELKTLFRQNGFDIYHIYGDWMRPSFFYRSMREAFKKIGVRLPLYPASIPVLSKIRGTIRRLLNRVYLSFYTFMDIGVIGVKRNASV